MRYLTALTAAITCSSGFCAAQNLPAPLQASLDVSTSSSPTPSILASSALSNSTRSSLAISTPKWHDVNGSAPYLIPYPMFNSTQLSRNVSNTTTTVTTTWEVPLRWTTSGGDGSESASSSETQRPDLTSTVYTTVNGTAIAVVYMSPVISVTTYTVKGSVLVYTYTSTLSGASSTIGPHSSPASRSSPHTFSTVTKTGSSSEMTSPTIARSSRSTSSRRSRTSATSSRSESSTSSEMDSSTSATSSKFTTSSTSGTSVQSTSSASSSSPSTSATSSSSATSTTSSSAAPKPTDKPEDKEEEDDRKDLIAGVVGGGLGFASLLGLSAAWWAHKSWSTAKIASDTLSSIGIEAISDTSSLVEGSVWSGVESTINSVASGLNLVESETAERIEDLRFLHGLLDPAEHLSSVLANAAQYRVTQLFGSVMESFNALEGGAGSQGSRPQFKLGNTLPLVEEDLPVLEEDLLPELFEGLSDALWSHSMRDSLGRSNTPKSYAERFTNELRYATSGQSMMKRGYPAVDTMVMNALEFLHTEQTSILSKVVPEADLDWVKMQERRWKTAENVMDSIRDDGLFRKVQPDITENWRAPTEDLLVNQLRTITRIVLGLGNEMANSLKEYHRAARSQENQWEYVNHLSHQENLVQEALDVMLEFADAIQEANNPDLSRDEINKIAKDAVGQYRQKFDRFMDKNAPQPRPEDALYDPHEKDWVDPYRYPGERMDPGGANNPDAPLQTAGPSPYDPKAPPQTGAPDAPQGTAAPESNSPKVTVIKGMDQTGFWTVTRGSQPTSGPLETVTVYAQSSQARPTSSGSSGDTWGPPSAPNSSTFALQFEARAKTSPFWNPGSPDIRCGSQQFQSIRLFNTRGFETPRSIAPISKEVMLSAVDTFVNTSLSLWNGRTFTTSYGDPFQTVTLRGWSTPDKDKPTNGAARQMAVNQGDWMGKAREIAMHVVNTCGPDGGQYSSVGFGHDQLTRPGGFGMEIFGSLACQLDGSCPNAVMHWPHYEPNEPSIAFTEDDWRMCKASGTCPNRFPDWNRLPWAELGRDSPFVRIWVECHADGSCGDVRIPWEKMDIEWSNVPEGSALREICKGDSGCRMD